MKNTAKQGDWVRIRCSKMGLIALTDAPQRVKALAFTVGDQEVLPGISLGVLGMATGDVKQLTLQPETAFGVVHPALIKTIPIERFPADLELRVGKWLTSVGVITGRRRRVKIIRINSDTVVVDGNHPLAGRVLEMEFELIALDSFTGKHVKLHQDIGGEA